MAQLPGTEAAICYPWPRPAMVSPLTDAARAKKLSRLMHGWLSEDLQLSLPKLESTKGRIYTFAAFLGAP